MKSISYLNVDITGGFWKKKLDMISDVTVDSVYNRFKETYRFDAFDCTWKEGDPNQPHVFWDSDIAKWIEGLAYSLKNKPNDKMVKIADETIGKMEKNRDENGYYNSHFLVTCHNIPLLRFSTKFVECFRIPKAKNTLTLFIPNL